jgi:hypothetical protein
MDKKYLDSVYECCGPDHLDYHHYVEEPISLKCGHSICKNCLPSNKIFKCKLCGKINKRDLAKRDVDGELQKNILIYLPNLFLKLRGKLEKEQEKFKSKFLLFFGYLVLLKIYLKN